MMDEDEYRDHLVDTAKDLLEAMEDGPEQSVTTEDTLEPKTPDEPGIDAVDRHEPDFLARNRAAMSNNELEDFLAGDSAFHEALADQQAFTRWEQRFLIQHHHQLSVEQMAAELDREPAAIQAALQLLGIDE